MNLKFHTATFIKNTIRDLVSDKLFSEIFRGSGWAAIARIFAVGFGLIANIIIARVYGAEILGIIAIIESILLITTIFTMLGLDTSILRLIPEHIAKHSTNSAYKVYCKSQFMVIGISIMMSVILFFLSEIIANKVFSKAYLSSYISLTALFIVFKSLQQLNTQAVRGLKLIKTFAFMQALPQTSNLIIIVLFSFFFFLKDLPIYAFLGSFAITGIIGLLIMNIQFMQRIQLVDYVYSMPTRKIFLISVPMLLNSIMSFILAQTGVLMLGMLCGDAKVGYYSIAVKLSTLTTFVLSAINSMAAPKFSELFYSGEIANLFNVAKKSAKMIFWITTPILIILLLSGKLFLGIFFGENFKVAYPAMIFLVIGQFFNSISGSTGYFMNMTGHQNIFSNILSITVLINISLNYFLIPKIGINGSAIATMFSTIFWNLTTLIYLKMKFGKTTCYLPLFPYC